MSTVPLGLLLPPRRATPVRVRVATRLDVPVAAVLLATLGAVAATIWSASTHSMLLYGDARAHLDVARHVTDGLRTGPTQLGSVWLPLPHILMVPFTAVRVLWHTGATGAIVGGLCYVYATTRIFAIVEELTHDKVAAWVGFGLFAVNLDLLYLQSTALTEPVLLAALTGATVHLARWMRSFSVRELGWAAFLTALATLTRYEAWAYLVAGVGVVLLWSILEDRRHESGQANVVLYTALGSYGIVLWVIYNLTIFHDPFYFLHSSYSAEVMNGAQAQFGKLPTKGNLVQSFLTYGWDVVGVIRPLVVVAAGISCVLLVALRYPQRVRTLLTVALLAAPVAFEVVSLYVGQTTIRVPQLADHQMYNVRYGVMALPLCAVAIALVVARRPQVGAVLSGVAVVGIVLATFGTPITLADGRTGISSATQGKPELAARYLHEHYAGGRVLADDSQASTLVFAADLDLREFVTPGFHPFWERAIENPGDHVQWAVATPDDAIATDFAEYPERFADFTLVFTDGTTHVYEKTT